MTPGAAMRRQCVQPGGRAPGAGDGLRFCSHGPQYREICSDFRPVTVPAAPHLSLFSATAARRRIQAFRAR